VQAFCRRAERWLLHHSDLVMCMPALAAEMRARAPGARIREWSYPSLAEKMSAPQQEVDALREELCIPSGAPVVVYSGTFEAYQGLSMLLDAVPSVSATVPDAVFVVVGGTSRRDLDLDRGTGGQVPDGNVKILPRQPRDRMPLFLSMADVLACPRTYGNNLPLKILDYMAVGKPIVATDILAHRAVLDHDRALLVEPSSRGLAAGLVSALTDSNLAARIGTAAKVYCGETLSWRRFVGSIGEIYEELRRGYP
jgi:glycosyltransferase involved in cell wall biosynthesis